MRATLGAFDWETMLGLSNTAGYAIMALGYMEARGASWVLSRDIAQRTGISCAYLSKILHGLVRSGLIVAKRGYRGGFKLSRSSDKIDLMAVVEAAEGRAWAPPLPARASRVLGRARLCRSQRRRTGALRRAGETRTRRIMGLNRVWKALVSDHPFAERAELALGPYRPMALREVLHRLPHRASASAGGVARARAHDGRAGTGRPQRPASVLSTI